MSQAILLPKALNINAVGELLKEVKSALSNSEGITLDAKDVEEIDALGLQLIFSVEKTAQMNSVEFKLINAQEKLKNSLNSSFDL